MKIGQEIPLIPGVFGLASVRNRGAAFGILQGQTLFFIAMTVILIGIIIYLPKAHLENKNLSYGLFLILGGALGNFFDRVVKGEVVDMIQVYLFIVMVHSFKEQRNRDTELKRNRLIK